MKVQNKNASSAKTRALIRKTTIEMMAEKRDLRKISVSELVQRANIHRTTFYAHYSDIYEIVEELENETIQQLFEGRENIHTSAEAEVFLKEMLSYFKSREDDYKMILISDDPMRFLKKLSKMIKDTLKKCVSTNQLASKKLYLYLQIDLFVDGMAEEFIRYFRGNSSYSIDLLSEGLLYTFRQIIAL
ncbi:MAG: hypothetical protein LKM35_04305 [Lachnospiraceae bacterium]|jgi:AcrR family transcriptional regulator|nr:hypothetical protein [Lachnospiraceae bacterium]